jgi:hypothetical protein
MPLAAVSVLGLSGTALAVVVVAVGAVIALAYVNRPITQATIDRQANSRSVYWLVGAIFMGGFLVLAYEFNHWGPSVPNQALTSATSPAPVSTSHGLTISWGCPSGEHEVVLPTADGMGHHVCALDKPAGGAR